VKRPTSEEAFDRQSVTKRFELWVNAARAVRVLSSKARRKTAREEQLNKDEVRVHSESAIGDVTSRAESTLRNSEVLRKVPEEVNARNPDRSWLRAQFLGLC
jgi:hypothetical protein